MSKLSATRPRSWIRIAALVGVVALAVALRFYGLRWGLPGSLHSYSYHPDEFLTLGAAFGAVYLGRSLNPGLFNYPSLYIYAAALAIAVALGYGMEPDGASIYLCARVVTAAMGVAAVAITYWAGRALFGVAAGLVGALILCVAPLHVQHSHFATVDVPSTFFVAAALGFAGMVLKRGAWRDYVLGGAIAGLAAGTKYNAGFVILAVIAAHFMREKPGWGALRSGRLWTAFACAAAAFLVSTPGAVLYAPSFLYGLTYEMRHAATGHGLVFAGTGSGFVYTFASSLWYGLGPGLAMLFAAAVVWAIARRDRAALVVLAFALPYYALVSVSQVRFARYALPLLPTAALLTGWLAHDVWLRLSRWSVPTSRWVWAAACALAVAQALVNAVTLDRLFTAPDPRDQAARWISAHVREGASVGVVEVPWFYSPPLARNLGFGTLDQRREAAGDTPYELIIFDDCAAQGEWFSDGDPPRWVVLSDFETSDAERLRGSLDLLSADDRSRVIRILRDVELIRKHYTERARFGDVLEKRVPHDMRYVSPVITIYETRQ